MDDVTSLQLYQLNKLLGAACVGADDFTAELTALLQRYQFKQSFIDDVVPDLLDAYMNEDSVPLWHRSFYKPPEK